MFTLVPSQFFDPASCARALSEVADYPEKDEVRFVEIPRYSAVLIYNVSGGEDSLPEIFYMLEDLPSCSQYNKILCSWLGSTLYLAIAQGNSLLLANSFPARDFSTALYWIFLSMKSLQLNPEVSTISLRQRVSEENELLLYRYFKSVQMP